MIPFEFTKTVSGMAGNPKAPLVTANVVSRPTGKVT